MGLEQEMSEKRDNQRDKILIWLQMRGKKGILNTT